MGTPPSACGVRMSFYRRGVGRSLTMKAKLPSFLY